MTSRTDKDGGKAITFKADAEMLVFLEAQRKQTTDLGTFEIATAEVVKMIIRGAMPSNE